MMEEETHVDSISSGEHKGICQVLFEATEDQSEVCGRAERAISGLSQSNQWRLGKSEGKPGTQLPANSHIHMIREDIKILNLSILMQPSQIYLMMMKTYQQTKLTTQRKKTLML